MDKPHEMFSRGTYISIITQQQRSDKRENRNKVINIQTNTKKPKPNTIYYYVIFLQILMKA